MSEYKVIEDSFLDPEDMPKPDEGTIRRWIGKARKEGREEGREEGLLAALEKVREIDADTLADDHFPSRMGLSDKPLTFAKGANEGLLAAEGALERLIEAGKEGRDEG